MPRKKLKKSHEIDIEQCKLCFSSYEDEAIFGKKLKTDSGNVHYFCILFACGLEQNGSESEGVYGFLNGDIRREILRANKLKCSYCRRNTVASACAVKACKVKFHFNCGLTNNVLFQYFESFESYCAKHRPPLDERYNNIDNELTCYICLEKFNEQENSDENLKYKVLLTSCCSKFLHISCVKRQAFNAGIHFLKCPLCNDRDLYIECVQNHGVYIPDEDAKWEGTQVWRDQEERYASCDANNCKCDRGREFAGDDYSEWEIYVCSTCGSCGVHAACSNVEIDESWECSDCKKLSNLFTCTKNITHRLNEMTSDFQIDEQDSDTSVQSINSHHKEAISNQIKEQISNPFIEQIGDQSNSQMNESHLVSD